ncbi:MAG: DUF2950 family protein [Planctomycetota bacterium]|nr:DUF2950 family protein [Planctomycetota bacterium]
MPSSNAGGSYGVPIAIGVLLLGGGAFLLLMPTRGVRDGEKQAAAFCKAYLESQQNYRKADWDGDMALEYAQLGTGPNSLHHPSSASGSAEILTSLAATAFDLDATSLPAEHTPFLARILTRQGSHAPGGEQDFVSNGNMTKGHAVVVWPRAYGVSGRRTYMMNHTGVIFAKDLGDETDATARAMKAFDPDETWEKVE